jgi:formate dehydrogenase subunit gamma
MPETVKEKNSGSVPPSKPATITRSISEREAVIASKKLVTSRDGTVYVVRFSLLARVLHFLLLLAVTGLAFTGLAQVLYHTFLGELSLSLLGGVEATQAIHHVFAVLLAVLVVFHVLDIVESMFVRKQTPGMLPRGLDLQAFFQMLKFNLGLSKQKPRFDRFSYEEKAVYWLLTLGILLLGVTGLIQWFPIQVTLFLPGITIPYASILHRWEAILVILVVFIWHLYQVLYSKVDASIFSGRKSRADMLRDHPLELEYLEKAAASIGSPTWPVVIELNLTEDLSGELVEPPASTEPSGQAS